MRTEVRVIQSQDLGKFDKLMTDAVNSGWTISDHSFNVSDKGYSVLSHKHITDEPAPSDQDKPPKSSLSDRIMCGLRIK